MVRCITNIIKSSSPQQPCHATKRKNMHVHQTSPESARTAEKEFIETRRKLGTQLHQRRVHHQVPPTPQPQNISNDTTNINHFTKKTKKMTPYLLIGEGALVACWLQELDAICGSDGYGRINVVGSWGGRKMVHVNTT